MEPPIRNAGRYDDWLRPRSYDIIDVMNDRGAAIYAILREVRPIVLHSTRVVEHDVRELGWTVGSRAVVEVLAAAGPLTAPQIADRLSLARQNVQRQIDDLVRLAHVEVVPNPAHRRSVLARLTRRGAAAFRQLHARELDALSGMAQGFSDKQIQTAGCVLASLDHDIQERATRPDGADA